MRMTRIEYGEVELLVPCPCRGDHQARIHLAPVGHIYGDAPGAVEQRGMNDVARYLAGEARARVLGQGGALGTQPLAQLVTDRHGMEVTSGQCELARFSLPLATDHLPLN